jgi:hypothetical protein
MREKVQQQSYVMTLHAEDEMYEDGYTIFDVENVILTGVVIERQQDTYNTDEWKYIILGEAQDGQSIEIVSKIGLTEHLVIITVYRP